MLFDRTLNTRVSVWWKRKRGRGREGGGVIAFSFCFDWGWGGGVKQNFENGSRISAATGHNLHTEIYKGYNYVKTIGIYFTCLCNLSSDALHLYQVSRKYLKEFQLLNLCFVHIVWLCFIFEPSFMKVPVTYSNSGVATRVVAIYKRT